MKINSITYNNVLYHVIGVVRQWREHYWILDAGIIAFLLLKANKKKVLPYSTGPFKKKF